MPLGEKSFFTGLSYQLLKVRTEDGELCDCEEELKDGADQCTILEFALYASKLSCHHDLDQNLEVLHLLPNTRVDWVNEEDVVDNGVLGTSYFLRWRFSKQQVASCKLDK